MAMHIYLLPHTALSSHKVRCLFMLAPSHVSCPLLKGKRLFSLTILISICMYLLWREDAAVTFIEKEKATRVT